MNSRADWAPIADAAARVERRPRTIYEWIAAAPDRIRTMRVRGRLYVHLDDLIAHESTIPAPGRPRKAKP